MNWQQELANQEKVTDWIAICDSEDKQMIQLALEGYIWNSGCLYIINNKIMMFNVLARALRNRINYPKTLNANLAIYYEPSKIIQIKSSRK